MTDPTDNKARVVLNCGTLDINCYFDNVSVKELLPSSVMDDMSVPSIFTLKNYPNPFNPETKIEFSLPMELFVTVTVFDIRGRIVSTLINEKLSAGEYAVTFDAATLPSGVYFYKLETDSIVQVRKMMLVK